MEILAFPCNQFGEEEPGSNEEITEFVCTRFKSEFPIFDKVDRVLVYLLVSYHNGTGQATPSTKTSCLLSVLFLV